MGNWAGGTLCVLVQPVGPVGVLEGRMPESPTLTHRNTGCSSRNCGGLWFGSGTGSRDAVDSSGVSGNIIPEEPDEQSCLERTSGSTGQ